MLCAGIRRFQSANSRIPTGIIVGGVRFGSNIQVILLKDLDRKGARGDIVQVKRGHARNLLIPRKIAVYATLDNKEQYANIINTEHIKDIVKKHDKLQELSNEPLIMERLLDPEGNLYGAIGTIEITYTMNKFNIGVPIYPSDIFGVPKDGFKEEGEHSIEVCGIPFKVEVVGIKQSHYEVECSIPRSGDLAFDASLNR